MEKNRLNIPALFLFIAFLVKGQICWCQTAYDSLKTELKNTNGTDWVDISNQISKLYEHEDPDSSIHYATRAEFRANELNYPTGKALAFLNQGNYYLWTNNHKQAIIEYDRSIELYDAENDKDGLQKALNNKGNVYRMNAEYDLALYNFLESMKISEELGYKKGIAYASLNAGLIYANILGESETKGLPYFFRSLEICREINDLKCVAYAINNIALVYSDIGEYNKSLEYHAQSLALKRAAKNQIGIASSLGNISDIYTHTGDYQTSLRYNYEALEIFREINDHDGILGNLVDIGRATFMLEKFDEAALILKEALSMSKETNSLQLKSAVYQCLYEFHLERKDYKQALEFHQLYIIEKDSIYTENSSEQIAEMKTLYETEKKEAAITQLTNEKTIQELQLKKSENLKRFFTVASLLTLLLAVFGFYGFRQKQKANVLLEERNKLEVENKKRAISLFGQQVSKEVASELLSDSFKGDSKKLFACIMFLDIRGFTPLVENKSPSEIIQFQNDVFGFMIDIISKHNGIINQFLGDGFMATFGAPASFGNDSQNAVNASLEIVEMLSKKCGSGELPETKIGIGMHSGHIVTGNVGTTERKQYSITGNTVILASRIEQLNKKYNSEILISKDVLEKLDQSNLKILKLGAVQLKGRAEPLEIVRLL